MDKVGLLKLAQNLPQGDPLRRAILSGVRSLEASPLPREGVRPFRELLQLVEALPPSPLRDRMLDSARPLMDAAQKFYRGERYRPQVNHIVEDLAELASIAKFSRNRGYLQGIGMEEEPDRGALQDIQNLAMSLLQRHEPLQEELNRNRYR